MNNQLEKPKRTDEETDLAPKVFGFAALGVMAAMFALMGYSMTIIIFLALIGYFVWRAVARTEIGEVRGIFEFYLQANDVLRDDERRWYGFEIQDVIHKGQRILGMMPDPPPLVHFTLGALHHRIGNFAQAENHFAFLLEDAKADEINRATASSELKSYVRILRKLEREPAEAPQTTAAIRALERARRHRATALLAESREKSQALIEAQKAKELSAATAATAATAKLAEPVKPLLERLDDSGAAIANHDLEAIAHDQAKSPQSNQTATAPTFQNSNGNSCAAQTKPQTAKNAGKKSAFNDKQRLPISEVLRDLYD